MESDKIKAMTQAELPGLEPPPPPLTLNERHPDGGKFPAFVTEQLEENKRGGGSRSARFHRCHLCYEIVMTGLEDDTLAMTVTVDPTPIRAQVEQALNMIGRNTYEALKKDGSYRLYWRAQGFSNPSTTGSIVPQHKCGQRFPGFIIGPDRGAATGYEEGLPF